MPGHRVLGAALGGAPQAVLAKGHQKHQQKQLHHHAGQLHRRGHLPGVGAAQQQQRQVGEGVGKPQHHGEDAGHKGPLGGALLVHAGKELAQVEQTQQRGHAPQHGEEVFHKAGGLGVKHVHQNQVGHAPQHPHQVEQPGFLQAVFPGEKPVFLII